MTDLTNAARLYRAFREEEPRRARLSAPLPKAVAKMGTAEFLGYLTTHAGKVVLYVHYFAPGSRPEVCAPGSRRNQLFLFGGRFKVTGRGITDLDSRGRVVEFRTSPWIVVERWKLRELMARARVANLSHLTNRRRRP